MDPIFFAQMDSSLNFNYKQYCIHRSSAAFFGKLKTTSSELLVWPKMRDVI